MSSVLTSCPYEEQWNRRFRRFLIWCYIPYKFKIQSHAFKKTCEHVNFIIPLNTNSVLGYSYRPPRVCILALDSFCQIKPSTVECSGTSTSGYRVSSKKRLKSAMLIALLGVGCLGDPVIRLSHMLPRENHLWYYSLSHRYITLLFYSKILILLEPVAEHFLAA